MMKAGQLQKIRKRLGLTQQQLADHLEVSRALVARWENGSLAISARSAMAIDALAIHLGRPDPDWPRRERRLTSRLAKNISKRTRPFVPVFTVDTKGHVTQDSYIKALGRFVGGTLTAIAAEMAAAVARDDLMPEDALEVFDSTAASSVELAMADVQPLINQLEVVTYLRNELEARVATIRAELYHRLEKGEGKKAAG